MLNKAQAEEQIQHLGKRLEEMEAERAECEVDLKKKQADYAKLYDHHRGSLREPRSLRTQEKSINTVRSKIEALNTLIARDAGRKVELEGHLRLSNLHSEETPDFLASEEDFRAVSEAMNLALTELREKITAFNNLVDHFFTKANLPLEKVQHLLSVVDDTISLKSFVREGKIKETEDRFEFLEDFGTMFKEAADILPALDEELLAQLAHSGQALMDWKAWAWRARWTDVVKRNLDFIPKERKPIDATPIKIGLTSTVARMPLNPQMSDSDKLRMEELAVYKQKSKIREVDANAPVEREQD